MKINTTVPALHAQRQAGIPAKGLNQTLEGLAGGLRINRAAG
jgi:flagellin-like hook-associated protein FlgL